MDTYVRFITAWKKKSKFHNYTAYSSPDMNMLEKRVFIFLFLTF